MEFFIVILAVALVVSLAFNMGFFGGKAPSAARSESSNASSSASAEPDQSARLAKLESELDRKRKELEEVKKGQNELKDELKAAKKRLHELKEADKDGDDLKRARAEVERNASVQLDATRAELSAALTEIQRLKGELELRGKRAAAPVEKARSEEPKRAEAPPPQRIIRELSDVEKERIARLEQQSSNDRRKAIELEREVRNLKAKIDKQLRDVKSAFQESNLAKDKFRAVEKRLNRTLIENDMLRRAIVDLEKKTGISAERTALTAEEVSASDATMAEKHAAEDRAAAEAKASLEAQHARELEAAHAAADVPPAPASAPVEVAPPAPTPTPAEQPSTPAAGTV